MLAGAGEPCAVRRALDLDQALGAAAARADLPAERWARALGLTCTAERTEHSRTLCVALLAHLGNSATPLRLLERTTSVEAARTVLWVVASKGSPVFEQPVDFLR